MKNKKEALRTQLDKFLHLFMLAKESFLYTEYFHNPETPEERELLNDTVYFLHFRFINHILFRNTVIELAKIYSNKGADKLRLSKFIANLKRDGQYGDLGVTKDSIEEIESCLIEFKSEIDNIITLRDELYAHTDTKEFEYDSLGIELNRLDSLLKRTELFIGQVYSVIYQSDIIFESPKFDRKRFPILKVLALGETKRKEEIFSVARASLSSYKK
jgi:AbiU2